MDWKISYSVGIEEIDAQHRQLIVQFKRVTDAIEAQENWSDIHYKIVDMRRYAEFHFEFEEGLMRMFGYPQAEGHAMAHRDFFVRLDEIERSSLHDKVHEEMIRFLYDWLLEHILGSDRGYVEHILAGAAAIPSQSR